MNVEYKAKSLQPTEYDNDTYEVEQVTLCPICKKSISPVHLNSVFRGDDNFIYIESHLLCKGCFHSFIASYRCPIDRNGDVDIGELIVKPQIISGDFHRLYKVEIPVTVCG